MPVIKWNAPDSPETILTTELNGITNGSNKLSAALSNDAAAELDLYADFELYLSTQGTNRAVGAHVSVYILTEMDASNYTYGSDSLDPPSNALVGMIQFDSGSLVARYSHLRGVELPPTDFKVLVQNNTGQTLAATLNVLKMVRYNMQSS